MDKQYNENNKKVFPLIFKKKVEWFTLSVTIISYNIVAFILLSYEEGFKDNGFVDKNKEDLFLMLYNNLSLLFYLSLVISIITIIKSLKCEFKGKNRNLSPMSLPENREDKSYMIKYGLVHTVAIYGIIFFLISGNFNYMLIFTALSLIGMLLHYPRK